ncbi:hypothetical protein O9992_24130 [Vibrio lentus]|nr:hypothetical protein [Vibrio lentus]
MAVCSGGFPENVYKEAMYLKRFHPQFGGSALVMKKIKLADLQIGAMCAMCFLYRSSKPEDIHGGTASDA